MKFRKFYTIFTVSVGAFFLSDPAFSQLPVKYTGNLPGSATSGTTLPVTLVEFTGKEQDSAAALNWDVREEQDLHSYELQRSNDGLRFDNIALVFPWDNQQAYNQYEYLDSKAKAGLNFYRLKMVDMDGKFKLSNIIAVHIGQEAANQVTVAPNPARENIRIILSGLPNGAYRMELHSAAGQLQLKRSFNISQRDQIEYIDRNVSSAPGVYWLSVYNKNNQQIGTSRVIVQ